MNIDIEAVRREIKIDPSPRMKIPGDSPGCSLGDRFKKCRMAYPSPVNKQMLKLTVLP
jgi:hypothetical protein